MPTRLVNQLGGAELPRGRRAGDATPRTIATAPHAVSVLYVRESSRLRHGPTWDDVEWQWTGRGERWLFDYHDAPLAPAWGAGKLFGCLEEDSGRSVIKTMSQPEYDIFLSHDHDDSSDVEEIGRTLEVKFNLRVWFDKWCLIPGKSWQEGIAVGLEMSATCGVCIGGRTGQGWFQQELERALNRQVSNPDYRVIPILLPSAPPAESREGKDLAFIDLRTCVDFRPGIHDPYAYHLLSHGICGTAPGPWPPLQTYGSDVRSNLFSSIKQDLEAFDQIRPLLHETVVIETQRRIVSRGFK